MKKFLCVITALVLIVACVSCSENGDDNSSSKSVTSSEETSNTYSSSDTDASAENISSENNDYSLSTEAEIDDSSIAFESDTSADLEPDRVIGGFTVSYQPYYSFSFNDAKELDCWLNGNSQFRMTDEKMENVKIHENEAAEKLRLLLKNKDFYCPTIKGEVQKTSHINVWQMYENCAHVQYTVYGEGGSEYDISFKYFFGEETVSWLKGGIANYHTKLYEKTGSAGLSPKYVYSLSSFPVYDHMNYRLLDTEVLVSQLKEDISVSFAFDDILVMINGSPYTAEAGEYSPENYQSLGFYDMTYVEPIS